MREHRPKVQSPRSITAFKHAVIEQVDLDLENNIEPLSKTMPAPNFYTEKFNDEDSVPVPKEIVQDAPIGAS